MSDSCDPMDCSLPGSSVHGVLQARVLEWVAMSSLFSSFLLPLLWPDSSYFVSFISFWTCFSTYDLPFPGHSFPYSLIRNILRTTWHHEVSVLKDCLVPDRIYPTILVSLPLPTLPFISTSLQNEACCAPGGTLQP